MRPGFGAYAGIRMTVGGSPSSAAPAAATSGPGMVPPSPTPRSQGTM
jgi:hypothetical protein